MPAGGNYGYHPIIGGGDRSPTADAHSGSASTWDADWRQKNRQLQRLGSRVESCLLEYARRPGTSGAELDRVLSEFSELIQKTESSLPPNPPRHHTYLIQRHKDVLSESINEKRRLQEKLRARKQQSELLRSVRQDINSKLSTEEYYIKERTNVEQAHSSVDILIGRAIETQEELSAQRGVINRGSSRLQNVTAAFPALNTILRKIGSRQRRDTVVLAMVTGICFITLFWYIL